MLFIFCFQRLRFLVESSSPSDFWQEEAARGWNVVFGVQLGFRAIPVTDWLDVHTHVFNLSE